MCFLAQVKLFVVTVIKMILQAEMLLFQLANQISITGLFELNKPKGKILVIKITLLS